MLLQPRCAFHSERLADELQPWDWGQYSRLGCFYLLCLSERLQLLWFDESLIRLEQKIVLCYCHHVETVILEFISKIPPSSQSYLITGKQHLALALISKVKCLQIHSAAAKWGINNYLFIVSITLIICSQNEYLESWIYMYFNVAYNWPELLFYCHNSYMT